MSTQPQGTTPPAASSASGGDWPSRAADLVETLVSLLRDKTVRPLALATRAIVFGIIVFAASVVTTVLLAVALIRLLTVYAFDGRVWASDLLVGALFVAAGFVVWSLRNTRSAGPTTGRL